MSAPSIECPCGQLRYRITGHNEKLGPSHKSTFEVVQGYARIEPERVVCRECKTPVYSLKRRSDG